jgi:hypothetical protein
MSSSEEEEETDLDRILFEFSIKFGGLTSLSEDRILFEFSIKFGPTSLSEDRILFEEDVPSVSSSESKLGPKIRDFLFEPFLFESDSDSDSEDEDDEFDLNLFLLFRTFELFPLSSMIRSFFLSSSEDGTELSHLVNLFTSSIKKNVFKNF